MPSLLVSPGARATQRHLLAEIDRLLAPGPGLLAALGRPVLVVVPSTALQLQFSAALTADGPRAGVRVVTLHALASEILGSAGEIPRRGAAMTGVLTRRFAAEEPLLAEELGHLQDGYGAAVASVRDLLEAGFEPVLLDPLLELLSGEGDVEAEIAAELGMLPPIGADSTALRAAAVLRVAAQVFESLEVLSVGERAWIFRRAAELLPTHPVRARDVLIAGFAEATGVMGDLVEGLMRWSDATVIVDRPADPAAAWRAEGRFVEPLLSRLETLSPQRALPADNPAPHREVLHAPGSRAELRAVAGQIRRLIDGGAAPEGIALVARDLSSRSAAYRPAIVSEFRRLAIPFSGLGAPGSDSVEARRVGALSEVLTRGPDARIDRWLEASGWLTEEGEASSSQPSGRDERRGNRLRRGDLGLAFAAAGLVRLGEVPDYRPAGELEEDGGLGIPLPVREKLVYRPDDPLQPVQALRRHLPEPFVRTAVERATSLCAFWSRWPEQAPLQVHLRHLRALLADELRFGAEAVAWDEVRDAVAEIRRVHELTLSLTLEEFRLLVLSQLAPLGRRPLGGRGAGVWVLSADEARGLTFEHLFVVGCNRDVFPARAAEDALLPDPLRRRLQALLPTLPLRGLAYAGERHLFAWLHTAAPHVAFSYQRVDDDGQPATPSPLLERLRWASGTFSPAEAPALRAADPPPGSEGGVPELAMDAAIRAGLRGARGPFAALLPLALAEARGMWDSPDLSALADARLRILAEIDPDLRTPEGRETDEQLGPYMGVVGAPRPGALDARHNALYVTTLEAAARCPWQAMLTHLLRIEPLPDPLHTLPVIEKWMLGELVHEALEVLLRPHLGEGRADLLAALQAGPVSVPWPAADAVEEALLSLASEQMQRLGMSLPGMVLVMRDMAEPYLESARKLDWREGAVDVLGVEIEGEVRLGRRSVRFKADRADLHGGALRLTDYKTGRSIDTGKREETRLRRFLGEIRSGKRLQAPTYTLADAPHPRRQGRFLFLDPDGEDHAREFAVGHADEDMLAGAHGAFEAVLDAWEAGVFFPRLTDAAGAGPGEACQRCQLRAACRVGDTGYRRRLTAWVRAQDAREKLSPEGFTEAERALLRLWRLAGAAP